MTELEVLKDHIDEKFAHHEAMDRMRHSGIERLKLPTLSRSRIWT